MSSPHRLLEAILPTQHKCFDIDARGLRYEDGQHLSLNGAPKCVGHRECVSDALGRLVKVREAGTVHSTFHNQHGHLRVGQHLLRHAAQDERFHALAAV